MQIRRSLELNSLVKSKSGFLFGPRATGKSWLIRNTLKDAQIFDLLDDDIFSRFLKRPRSLGEEVKKPLVVIDEIQKLPRLLDEVHRLIEAHGTRFLLTGSSARKLKRGGANLLAGRARSAYLFPFTSHEIPDFSLINYLNNGGLPLVYNSDDPKRDLKEYVNLYLREEVQAEALVRRIDHFARFLDVFGMSSGELFNFQSIANDSGVPPRTVSSFLEVLKDTLIAYELEPFRKTKNRKAVAKSKVYIFDIGVANALAERDEVTLKHPSFGVCFEHFILQEVRAALSYSGSNSKMYFWRSQTGGLEVDLIIDQKVAIELKSTSKVQDLDLKGLKALKEEGLIKKYYLVSQDPISRISSGIEILPYKDFLAALWSGKLLGK